jgi:flagellar assembly factor FliW
MIIQSERFGSIEVDDKEVLTFEHHILGFQGINEYILHESQEDNTFLWLQSVKDPSVGFPLIETEVLHDPYLIKIHGSDLIHLGTTSYKDEAIGSYAMVSFGTRPKSVTANFVSPILIHFETRKGVQIILDSGEFDMEAEIYDALCKAAQNNFFNRRRVSFGPSAVQRITKTVSTPISSQEQRYRLEDIDYADDEPSIH